MNDSKIIEEILRKLRRRKDYFSDYSHPIAESGDQDSNEGQEGQVVKRQDVAEPWDQRFSAGQHNYSGWYKSKTGGFYRVKKDGDEDNWFIQEYNSKGKSMGTLGNSTEGMSAWVTNYTSGHLDDVPNFESKRQAKNAKIVANLAKGLDKDGNPLIDDSVDAKNKWVPHGDDPNDVSHILTELKDVIKDHDIPLEINTSYNKGDPVTFNNVGNVVAGKIIRIKSNGNAIVQDADGNTWAFKPKDIYTNKGLRKMDGTGFVAPTNAPWSHFTHENWSDDNVEAAVNKMMDMKGIDRKTAYMHMLEMYPDDFVRIKSVIDDYNALNPNDKINIGDIVANEDDPNNPYIMVGDQKIPLNVRPSLMNGAPNAATTLGFKGAAPKGLDEKKAAGSTATPGADDLTSTIHTDYHVDADGVVTFGESQDDATAYKAAAAQQAGLNQDIETATPDQPGNQ